LRPGWVTKGRDVAGNQEAAEKPNKGAGVFALVLSNPVVLIPALGVLLYALSRGGYQVYYGHYGLTPEEVGLDYITLLTREAVPIGLLVVLLVILFMPTILIDRRISRELAQQRFQAEVEARRRGESMSQGEADEDRYIDLVRRRADLFQHYRSRLVNVTLTAAAVVLVGWLAALYTLAATAGIGPYHPPVPFAPLQVQTHETHVFWIRQDGTTRRLDAADVGLSTGSCQPDFLYLGQADSLVVLYETCTREVVRLPSDRVYLA
jgi:hypothetical protein